jgi:tetratricopeptide (TPR) repeat protein
MNLFGNWLIHILNWLISAHRLSTAPSAPTEAPLAAALDEYRQALDMLNDDAQTLLAILLTRDRVAVALQETKSRSIEQVQHALELDLQLDQQTDHRDLSDLSAWRQTLQPPETAWWWFLDQRSKAQKKEAETKEKENDLPWILLTGTFLLLTGTLAIEIIRRLWAGAPDTISIFGTLLVVLLASSPLFKRGQELAEWMLERVPRLKPRYRAEAMVGMAGLALGVVIIVWFTLPGLARLYNNRGVNALLAGDLTAARREFERVVALDPEQVVAYQNMADVYARIGRPAEAITWYQKAVERDLSFGPAYDGQSHVLDEQGDFQAAERIALAGLRPENEASQPDVALVSRYGLLSNLGRAYFEQERYERAQEALEAAVALEDELARLSQGGGELRRAQPHYYLARLYERQADPEAAQIEWEETLRYLKEDNWADREWLAEVREKLNAP